MEPAGSPITGCNSEAVYRGTTYHVQTEDSGRGHPHVITHLFADGGRIVATRKTSYASVVGTSECAELVRFLIRLQHKTMLTSLTSGAYQALGEAKQEPSLPLESVRELLERARARAVARDATPTPTSTDVRHMSESTEGRPPAAPTSSRDSRADAVEEDWFDAMDVQRLLSDDLNEIIVHAVAAGIERPRR